MKGVYREDDKVRDDPLPLSVRVHSARVSPESWRWKIRDTC